MNSHVVLATDENMQTAVRYGVMTIPTLAFFKSGKLVDVIIGAVSKQFQRNGVYL
ncbi:MAG: thioredoxin domain-containing protein [bacterium]